jgi:hypothetical protein
MLGKTFKGMTDEMLAWQTAELQKLALSRDDYTVYVRPQLVVEVAFNDIQASPQYPGGLALRFARAARGCRHHRDGPLTLQPAGGGGAPHRFVMSSLAAGSARSRAARAEALPPRKGRLVGCQRKHCCRAAAGVVRCRLQAALKEMRCCGR